MNYQGGKVHIWTCDMCLGVLFEYWNDEDTENVAAELKAREKPKLKRMPKPSINFGSSFSM